MSSSQIINFKDKKFFEALFKEYYSPLIHFANQYIRDLDEAEDIVQQMFTKLWVQNQNVAITTSTQSYLYGAVRNACLNYLKHESVKNTHQEYSKHTLTQSDSIDFLELDELHDAIESAYAKIPEKCLEAFLLSRNEGKKYQEIAEIQNVTVKTIEKQMGKALKILRVELKDYLLFIILLSLSGGKF